MDTSSESDARGFWSRRRVGWLIVGILVVIYMVPYWYTSSPGACASCHSMKPFYRSWARSTHSIAASSCLDCHVRQNVFNLVTYRLMFYREMVAQVVGADLKPWGATIPGVESCHRSGCHSLNRLTSTSGELKINHRTHVVKARISCVKCHPGAAHKGVGKRFLLPPRKLCRKCHAAKMRTDCSYCHVKQVAQLPPGGH